MLVLRKGHHSRNRQDVCKEGRIRPVLRRQQVLQEHDRAQEGPQDHPLDREGAL